MLAQLQLDAQALGCPTSPIEFCKSVDLPDQHFLAYGAGAGLVGIAICQASLDSPPQPGVPFARQPEIVLAVPAARNAGRDIISVVFSSKSAENLLAAAAGNHIHLFSLTASMLALQGRTAPHAGPTPGDSQMLCTVQHSADVAALSWTQAGDGLLAADSRGCVAMYRVPEPGDLSGRGTRLMHVWTGSSSMLVQPQTLLAAGTNVMSPAASASPGSRQVTIWWPEQLPDAQEAAHQRQAQPRASPEQVAVLAEQLRHPAGVVGLEWSPGALQHGVSPDLEEDDEDEAGSPVAAATSQPALMTVGEDSVIRIWVEVTVGPMLGPAQGSSPGRPAMAQQPAGPTASGGGSGGARLQAAAAQGGSRGQGYAHVQQALQLSQQQQGIVQQPPAAASSPVKGLTRPHPHFGSSHFCVSLVIQAPEGVQTQLAPGTLRACWGQPDTGVTGVNHRLQSSQIMWVLAVAQQRALEGSTESQSEQLLLWALDGLSGVVINGIPNNLPGTRAASVPKAVLWGQHCSALMWPKTAGQRRLACGCSTEHAAPVLQVLESCRGEGSDTLLRTFELHTVDEVTQLHVARRSRAGISAGDQPLAMVHELPLHSLTLQRQTGHAAPVTALAQHPQQPLAASLDANGLVLLWAVPAGAPLQPLGSLSELSGAAQGQAGATAVAWLDPAAGGTQLAVGGAHGVDIYGLSRLGEQQQTPLQVAHLAAGRLPDEWKGLEQLTSLAGPRGGHQLLLGLQQHPGTATAQSTPPPVAVWQVLAPPDAQHQQAGTSSGGSLHPVACRGPELIQTASQATCMAAAPRVSGFDLLLGGSDGLLRLVSLEGGNSFLEQDRLACSASGQGQPTGIPVAAAASGAGAWLAAAVQSFGSADHLVCIWQATAASETPGFSLRAALPLPEAPTAVVWLEGCLPAVALAVADSWPEFRVFVRGRDGGFAPIAKLPSLPDSVRHLCGANTGRLLGQQSLAGSTAGEDAGPQIAAAQPRPGQGLQALTAAGANPEAAAAAGPAALLGSGPQALCQQVLLGAGSLLGCLSPVARATEQPDGPGRVLALVGQEVVGGCPIALAAVAAETGGPLPQFDPRRLRMLIERGRMQAASTAIRAMLQRLQGRSAAGKPDEVPGGDQKQPPPAVDALLDPNFLNAFTHVSARLPESAKAAAAQAAKAASAAPAAAAPAESSSAQTDDDDGPMKPLHASNGAAPSGKPKGTAGNAGSSTASSLPTDPFAFNMGAFDMGSSSAPANGTPANQQPASADPYAFDMGSFGGDPAPTAAPPPQQAPTAADPFAFNMGAFGMGGGSQQEAGQAESQPGPQPAAPEDPFAFNPGAFGMGDAAGSGREEQPDTAAPVPGAAADPFAFNPEAFGMGAPTQQAPSSAQAAPAPGSVADPFAFDPEAFGMGQPSQSLQHPPSSAQAGQSGDSTASNEDSISVMGTQRQGAPSVPSSRTMGTKLPGAAQSPARERSQGRQGTVQEAAAVFQPRRPGSKPADALNLEELEALERLLLPQADSSDGDDDLAGQADESQQIQSPWAAGEAIAADSARGLTHQQALEIFELAQLLCPSATQRAPPPTPHALEPAAGVPSPPGLPPADWAALDAAGQQLLRRLQLASLRQRHIAAELAAVAGAQPGAVAGRSREVADGLMASAHTNNALLGSGSAGKLGGASALSFSSLGHALPRRTQEEAANEAASWAEKAGLTPGLSSEGAMWGVLSESQEALLTDSLKLVPGSLDQEAAEKPMEFGFSTGPARAQPRQQLSWEGMRQAGAGFWLTDPQVVKSTAEALAKAQYAATKDPHSCALMYTALQRKALLTGLFRTANNKKVADFLGRDFSDVKNRTAASKNAFVLLGKHRHELAAAFFILAGSNRDAVGVCGHEMRDPQLALFLARLLEPGNLQLQQEVIEDRLLPDAQEAGDAWAVCLLQWLRGQPAAGLLTLVTSDHLTGPPPADDGTPSQTPSRTLPQPQTEQALVRSATRRHGNAPRQAPPTPVLDSVFALDFVLFCLQDNLNVWPGPLPSLPELHSLATAAAQQADVQGLPGAGLEALHVAGSCIRGLQRAAGGGHRHAAVLAAWRQRLVLAALVQGIDWQPLTALTQGQEARPGSATQKALAAHTAAWQGQAAAILARLDAAGIAVDQQVALQQLAVWEAALQAAVLPRPGQPGKAEGDRLSRSHSAFSGKSLISTRHSVLGPAVFEASHELLHVEGDRLHAVCASNAGMYGYAGGEGRPFVAASGHHGLIQGEVLLLDEHYSVGADREEGLEDQRKGSAFSALLGDMLEAVRWPGDPWTNMATPHMGGGVLAGGPHTRAATAPKPESPSAARVRAPLGQILTSTLCAHPTRQLYLSGSSSGEVFLCKFGDRFATAGYTPMPAAVTIAPSSAQSMFSAPPRSWNPAPGTSFTHWGQPQSVVWSDCGDRFAGIGDGGVVATWRIDAPRLVSSDTGYLGRSDWCHQGLSKRGMDVAFLGTGSSVLAVGGLDASGANIAIWDTQAPSYHRPVARLNHHSAAVTSLQVLPGGYHLASADAGGTIAVKDLRMLGGALANSASPRGSSARSSGHLMAGSPRKRLSVDGSASSAAADAAARGLLWLVRPTSESAGVVCMTAGLWPAPDGSAGGTMLVTGHHDGTIHVWSAGRGRHLQAIEGAHVMPSSQQQTLASKGRNFFSNAFKSARPSQIPDVVTDITVTADGLLSCSLGGSVRAHPFQMQQ